MTLTLLMPTLALLIGLVLLVWSSDIFVEGAASTSVHLSISPLIIGVVVLGFGTSMPEILVSTLAALDDSPSLAIGNAVGSNIVNIGLVLGLTAMIAPIAVKSTLIKRELPVLMGVSFAVYLLVLDGHLGITNGIALVFGLVVVMYWMIKVNKQADPSDPLANEISQELAELPQMPLKKSIFMIIGGLLILMASAKMMVWGAVEIAQFLGVDELIIGLTIVAVGTSLPELAASIAAARKNEADLMIGNIVGSNLFNILAVLSVPALLAPSILEPVVLSQDLPVMLGFTLALLLLAIPRKGSAAIGRGKGLLLTAAFVAYMVTLYLRSVQA